MAISRGPVGAAGGGGRREALVEARTGRKTAATSLDGGHRADRPHRPPLRRRV